MKTTLAKIQKVREYRVSSAMNVLAQKKKHAEDTLMRLTKKQEALLKYQEWRRDQEEKLFESVQNKNLAISEIEHLNLTVQWMRTSEIAFQQQVKDAEDQLKIAENEVSEAHVRYQTALKGKIKIDEAHQSLQKSAAKEMERLADEELDEFLMGAHK